MSRETVGGCGKRQLYTRFVTVEVCNNVVGTCECCVVGGGRVVDPFFRLTPAVAHLLNVANNANLDWFEPGESKHPVFGQLVDKKAFNVCVKISRVATRDDCPIKPVQVLSVAIDMRGSANLASPSDTANSATYFYLDKSEQEQGPFQLAEMRSWFSSGHLPASLRVREADDTDFRALEKHAALVAPLEQADSGDANGMEALPRGDWWIFSPFCHHTINCIAHPEVCIAWFLLRACRRGERRMRVTTRATLALQPDFSVFRG